MSAWWNPRLLPLGVAVAGAVSMPSGSIARVDRDVPTAAARRQVFVDRLVESGTVSSSNMHIYSSTLDSPAKLLFIVAEGTRVAPGDLLARLDVSGAEQALVRERSALRQAEAEAVRTREEIRVEALKALNDVDHAGQQTRTAQETLANHTSGRGAVDVLAAEVAVSEANRALADARATRDDMKPLLDEGFVTRAEFDRAEQALGRAEDQQRLAVARLEALVKFDRPAALARAEADLAAARVQADRQATAGEARIRERQAALAALSSRAGEVQARIDLLEDQGARASITAERPGLVVHREIYFGTDHRKPNVGDDIMPGQPLIAVPDVEAMTVETRVREIDLHRLAAGQPVRVQVDAYPGLEVSGRLAVIGAIAHADASRAGVKFFPVTVTIDEPDARMRTGMTAQVIIDTAAMTGALVIPAQAVVDSGGHAYVSVAMAGRFERRAVRVLTRTATEAVIGGGLAEGERVSLVPDVRPPR